MRYRIKKVTYKNNEVKYFAQYYKSWFSGWKSIYIDGELCKYADEIFTNKKESAFNSIELCEKGRNVLISLEYEYINK